MGSDFKFSHTLNYQEDLGLKWEGDYSELCVTSISFMISIVRVLRPNDLPPEPILLPKTRYCQWNEYPLNSNINLVNIISKAEPAIIANDYLPKIPIK
jgi:hypothetical protein